MMNAQGDISVPSSLFVGTDVFPSHPVLPVPALSTDEENKMVRISADAVVPVKVRMREDLPAADREDRKAERASVNGASRSTIGGRSPRRGDGAGRVLEGRG